VSEEDQAPASEPAVDLAAAVEAVPDLLLADPDEEQSEADDEAEGDEDDQPADEVAVAADDAEDEGDEIEPAREEDRVGADSVIGDYGVDAPGVVRAVAWAAGIAFAITLIAAVANVLVLMFVALAITILLTFEALSLVWSSRVAKLRERVHIVNGLVLGGDERVLDVGCGRGLLLVEVARRLTTGRVIGVDVWRDADQTENDPEFPLVNAEIEQVDECALVTTADARSLPFGDESFDAVVSSMSLHNIGDYEGRVNALREIDRVLAPGGKLVVVDFQSTAQYVEALRSCDWADVDRSRRIFRMFPPVHYVTGTKPGGPEPEEIAEPELDEEPEATATDDATDDAVELDDEPETTTEERDDSIWAPPELDEEPEPDPDPDPEVDEPVAAVVEPEETAEVPAPTPSPEEVELEMLRYNALVTDTSVPAKPTPAKPAAANVAVSADDDAVEADEKVTES
jgi:arsenite methyltransferase